MKHYMIIIASVIMSFVAGITLGLSSSFWFLKTQMAHYYALLKNLIYTKIGFDLVVFLFLSVVSSYLIFKPTKYNIGKVSEDKYIVSKYRFKFNNSYDNKDFLIRGIKAMRFPGRYASAKNIDFLGVILSGVKLDSEYEENNAKNRIIEYMYIGYADFDFDIKIVMTNSDDVESIDWKEIGPCFIIVGDHDKISLCTYDDINGFVTGSILWISDKYDRVRILCLYDMLTKSTLTNKRDILNICCESQESRIRMCQTLKAMANGRIGRFSKIDNKLIKEGMYI